ncbi:MAG TPA: DUF3014 domain-containing protein [Vicinamibacterales bacterium]|nr:DUF3014 domain-containing protein [Vicinamibacterales bacterium]
MDDKKPIALIAVALVVFLAGGAWFMSRPKKTGQNQTPAVVTTTEVPVDKGPPPPPVNLPPLDRMDGFLRPMLSGLSSRPELARWLATDDLVRQLAMAIDQAATGASPARDFKVIKPGTPFVPSGRGLRRTIDPASYRRYDGLVQTVTSIDASSVAKIYKTIRPRLDEAYRGLGNQTSNVDRGLAQVIDILLDTPVVKDPIAIVISDSSGGWAYEDDQLEALKPTQKQLLRMGSTNVDRMLVWLRAFQSALEK